MSWRNKLPDKCEDEKKKPPNRRALALIKDDNKSGEHFADRYMRGRLIRKTDTQRELALLIGDKNMYDKLSKFVASKKCAIKSDTNSMEYIYSTAAYLSWHRFTKLLRIIGTGFDADNMIFILKKVRSSRNTQIARDILAEWENLPIDARNSGKWQKILGNMVSDSRT